MRLLRGTVVWCLLLAGCGGGSSPAAATSTACTETLLLQGSASIPSRVVDVETLRVSGRGRIDIVVDWTNPASPIGVYLVRGQGNCPLGTFNQRACNFLIFSESSVKPRRLSVTGVEAGTFELLVGNFADVTESVSLQAFLRSEACPAQS